MYVVRLLSSVLLEGKDLWFVRLGFGGALQVWERHCTRREGSIVVVCMYVEDEGTKPGRRTVTDYCWCLLGQPWLLQQEARVRCWVERECWRLPELPGELGEMAVGGRTFATFGDVGSGLGCSEALFALRLFNTILFM